jgi:hypothetical protein
MGFFPIKAVFYSQAAYWTGRTLLTSRTAAGAPMQRWILPALLGALTIAFIAGDVRSEIQSGRERHARSATLTPDEVAVLVQRIHSGAANPGEHGAFLRNPLCPPGLLAEAVSSPDPFLRKAVAGNDKLDPVQAEKLASDENEEVRYYLSFNRDLPAPILSKLASDSSANVRSMVAWTKSLPDEDFERLVDDPSPEVRATVAIQPRISTEAVDKLRKDPVERVRNAANRWGQ